MSGGARSKKQERAQLVRALRSSGSSWVEVAEALRQSYQLNARVASVTHMAGVRLGQQMSGTVEQAQA